MRPKKGEMTMKIKNKKKMNVIIAAFMTVFMVGAAFAFTAQSNLIFQGTATVDASLQLVIMHDTDDVINQVRATGPATFEVSQVKGPGYAQIDLTLDFTDVVNALGGYFIPVRNTGSLPVVITGLDLVNWVNPYIGWGTYLYDLITITTSIEEGDAIGMVIQPGEGFMLIASFNFDASDFDGWYIDNAVLEFRLELEYAPA
jgi:hypothetical protein